MYRGKFYPSLVRFINPKGFNWLKWPWCEQSGFHVWIVDCARCRSAARWHHPWVFGMESHVLVRTAADQLGSAFYLVKHDISGNIEVQINAWNYWRIVSASACKILDDFASLRIGILCNCCRGLQERPLGIQVIFDAYLILSEVK